MSKYAAGFKAGIARANSIAYDLEKHWRKSAKVYLLEGKTLGPKWTKNGVIMNNAADGIKAIRTVLKSQKPWKK